MLVFFTSVGMRMNVTNRSATVRCRMMMEIRVLRDLQKKRRRKESAVLRFSGKTRHRKWKASSSSFSLL